MHLIVHVVRQNGSKFVVIWIGYDEVGSFLWETQRISLHSSTFSTPWNRPYRWKSSWLHCLRVLERISFRLSVLVYRCLHGSAPVRRQISSASPTLTHVGTALFKYVSHRCSTHPACYHRRPCLPGSCSVCLGQSAGVSSDIAITDSFLQ